MKKVGLRPAPRSVIPSNRLPQGQEIEMSANKTNTNTTATAAASAGDVKMTGDTKGDVKMTIDTKGDVNGKIVLSLDTTHDNDIVKLIAGLTKPYDNYPADLVKNVPSWYEVTHKQANVSTLLHTALENDKDCKEIKVNVTPYVLGLIVQYMKTHNGVEPPIVEKPLRSNVFANVCPMKSDAAFMDSVGVHQGKRHMQVLYDLITDANYMSITSLVHLVAAKIASTIKGRQIAEIEHVLDPKKGHELDANGNNKYESKADNKTAAGSAGATAAASAPGGSAKTDNKMDEKN